MTDDGVRQVTQAHQGQTYPNDMIRESQALHTAIANDLARMFAVETTWTPPLSDPSHGITRMAPETTIYDIMLTDDELQEREDWIRELVSRDPEDEEFEAELEQWE